MKKHDAKLTIRRNTLRTLDIAAVRGGIGLGSLTCDRPTDSHCNSDDEGSHARTCGDGTICGTRSRLC